MSRTILIFGGISVAIFFLFELNKLSVWRFEQVSEIFMILSGVMFILVGIFINKYLHIRKDHRPALPVNRSGLSKQEQKVLQLMTEGLSNQEIADQLFIAESTVKTHVSNILSKLKAKRRTEAVKIGRELKIV